VGLFDRLFKKGPSETTYAKMLNGYMPIFSQFGTSIYASDVIQSVLKCIVDELKKLQPTHIRQTDSDPQPIRGNVQNILDNPNPLMTSSEFIEKICWLLLMNYNVFIIPTYYTWSETEKDESGNWITVERRRYEALWPIKPIQVDFIEDASGKLYCKFYFEDGYNTVIAYDDVIHVKYNYSVNEFMGGDQFGQPDHQAILKTLELNHTLLQGVAKAMKASYAINGIIKYNTLMDEGKTQKALDEFERKLQNSESGILPIDMKSEVSMFDKKIALVDKPTLEFVDSKILRMWRVPLCILTGDYTPQQYEAFYQACLEPIIISISQAFTKKMFTQRQISFGNKIKLYPKELIFMTMDQTIRMIEVLSPTGALYENEKRAALGMRPDPELIGKRYVSLNWINADDASQYQVGNVNVDVVDEEKEDI
jgi:HK97 family phage portal protein